MDLSDNFLTEHTKAQGTRRRKRGKDTDLKAYLVVKNIDYEQQYLIIPLRLRAFASNISEKISIVRLPWQVNSWA
jgi:hypothetical protein